jgi:hypothetical protein
MSTGIKISNLTCSRSQSGSEIIPIVSEGVTLHTSLSTAVFGTLLYKDLSAGKIISNALNNKSPGYNSSVLGGTGQYAGGGNSVIVGGDCNNTFKTGGVVIGGSCNYNSGCNSIIVGGNNNIIENLDPPVSTAVIIGGCSNTISHSGTIIIGGSGINTTVPDYTYIENLSVMNEFSVSTFVAKDVRYENLVVTQNLSVLGDESIFKTIVSTTSALSVINDGTGPALFVQQTGNEPLAYFIDVNGDNLIIDDNGNLGLGVLSATEKITFQGNLSGSGNIQVASLTATGNIYGAELYDNGNRVCTTAEVDTLQSVTDRGFTTTNSLSVASLTATGKIIGGNNNTANGNNAAVLGGTSNTASGNCSSVVGGRCNTASGNCSFVGSGRFNTASGSHSFVGNGAYNTACGGGSFVGGGFCNTACGT